MKKKFAVVLAFFLIFLSACASNQVPEGKTESAETRIDEEATEDKIEKTEFYTSVIDKLINSDEALVYDTKYLAVDLSNNPLELDEAEMNELKAVLEDKYEKSILFTNYKNLVEKGWIDEEKPYWEDGAIISITGKKEFQNNRLDFKCDLWRSGLAAIFFDDCKAIWNPDGSIGEIEYAGAAIS